MFTLIPCLLCGQDRPATVWTHRGDSYLSHVGHAQHPVTWVLCQACGFVYQSPQPSTALMREVYQHHYWTLTPQKRAEKAVFAAEQVDWIKAHGVSMPGTILNVGSGDGALSEALREQGCLVTNVEVGQSLPQDQFALIVLSHVLEHLHEPVNVLHGLTARLQPGGWLFIEVPDVFRLGESPVLQSLTSNLLAAPHLWSFTLGHLRALLAMAGWSSQEAVSMPSQRGIVLRVVARPGVMPVPAWPRRPFALALRLYFTYYRWRYEVLARLTVRRL